jgi:hypothetical protein
VRKRMRSHLREERRPVPLPLERRERSGGRVTTQPLRDVTHERLTLLRSSTTLSSASTRLTRSSRVLSTTSTPRSRVTSGAVRPLHARYARDKRCCLRRRFACVVDSGLCPRCQRLLHAWQGRSSASSRYSSRATSSVVTTTGALYTQDKGRCQSHRCPCEPYNHRCERCRHSLRA